MQRHGIRKEIYGQAQEEANGEKENPVFLYGVPVQEKDIDHGVDKTKKIQPVEHEHLNQDEQNKAEGV
jgi:hypothetical protein